MGAPVRTVPRHHVPSPDGGWGWVVVFSSFILQVLTIGITYTFGILLVDLQVEFDVDKSTVAWIGSIQPCLLYFTGLVSGCLIERFGWRLVAMVGSILSAGGFFAASFAPNIYVMYATYGVLTGIGNGLMYLTSMVTVQHYFEKRRAMATGIAVSGSGVGTLVFGFLTQYLIEQFGWRNAVRIEAAIMLLGLVCAMVYRPLKHPDSDKETSTMKRDMEVVCSSSAETYVSVSEKPGPCCTFIDLSLFKNPVFIFFCLCMVSFCFGYHVPYTYTPDRAVEYGVSGHNAAFLVSIIGISNVCGRLVFGWFGDMNPTIRFYLGGLMLFLGGAISCTISLCNTYTTMVVYCILFGTFTGCWVSLFPVVLVDLLGVENIETSLGQVFAFTSIAFLFATPLSGFIIDKTHTFEAPYWVVGSIEMLGAVFYFCTRCFHRPRPGYEEIGERMRTESRRSFMTESFS